MGWKITDKFLVDPQDNDSVPFDQGGIVRRSTWAKIKDYILGTASLATIDKTVRGAINEVNTSLSDSANKIAQLSNPNLLINGDFQVWQRGTSFNTSNSYCADRWMSVFLPSGSVAKDIKGLKITGCGTGGLFIVQSLEDKDYNKLLGKTVCFSCDLSVENMLQGSLFMQITDSTNVLGKISIDKNLLSNTPKRFNIIVDIPATANNCRIFIGSVKDVGAGVINSDCNVYVGNGKLELGDKATPFVPRLYAEELVLCKRYYEKGQGQIVSAFGTGYLSGVNFQVEKRVSPTCTVSYITDLVSWATASYTTLINNVNGIAEIDGSGYTTNRLYRLGVWTADAEIY
ncbi:hypothetical protein [Clostridium beijerinckii]|uniref:Uncharacterized protein n=1 Tax=Clostridium beijerinckii TaxID=1520 RepID=A0AAX0B4V8_CLOBE|nr:hypothetical protein [Clostridium beijerinckii]NRT89453.1 hypothetical protein [Clostridium beijerinckii]NYC74909.1 hypothetical protein [Clostridium beijerinckii]